MRRSFVALALGLMIGISVPVMADHITEPTIPITGIRLRIYQYTNQAATLQNVRNDSGTTTTVAGCDGSVVVGYDNVRMETSVQALGIGNTGNPSEHYTEKVQLVEVINFGRQNESQRAVSGLDYVDWNHSNIPPHARPSGGSDRGWESSQNGINLSGIAPGTILRVVHSLRGGESGGLLVESCTFTVG